MIILASSSPRRRELLSMIGLNYVIETSGEEEVQPHGMPPAEFDRFVHAEVKRWTDLIKNGATIKE